MLVLLDSQIYPEPKASVCLTGWEEQEYIQLMPPWPILSHYSDLMSFWDHIWPFRLPASTPQGSGIINCLLWDVTFWLIIFMIWWMLPHGNFFKQNLARGRRTCQGILNSLLRKKCNSQEWCAEISLRYSLSTLKYNYLTWVMYKIKIQFKGPILDPAHCCLSHSTVTVPPKVQFKRVRKGSPCSG